MMKNSLKTILPMLAVSIGILGTSVIPASAGQTGTKAIPSGTATNGTMTRTHRTTTHRSFAQRHRHLTSAAAGIGAYELAKKTGRNRAAHGGKRNFAQRHPFLSGAAAAGVTSHEIKKHNK